MKPNKHPFSQTVYKTIVRFENGKSITPKDRLVIQQCDAVPAMIECLESVRDFFRHHVDGHPIREQCESVLELIKGGK